MTSLVYDRLIPDPATSPSASLFDLALSPDGNYVAVCGNGDAAPIVYEWTGTAWGAKVADPASFAAGGGNAVAWSPAGDYIAMAHNSSPYISVWEWTGSGFGAKVANPGTLATGNGQGVAWSPDGAYIALAHITSPRVTAWAFSSGFGAKVTDPATLPSGTGRGVAWNHAGDYIGVAFSNSPFIYAYPWSGGFGAPVANPATTPGSAHAFSVAWSPADDYVAVGHDATSGGLSVGAYVYPWSAGFGAKVADPATLPEIAGEFVYWTDDGDYLILPANIDIPGTPNATLAIYPWSAGFGTRVADPTDPLGSFARGAAVTAAGNVLAAAELVGGVTGRARAYGRIGPFPLRLFPRNDDLDGPRLPQFFDSASRSTRLGGTTYE